MLRAKPGSLRGAEKWLYTVHQMKNGHILLNGQAADCFSQADIASGSVAFAHMRTGNVDSSSSRGGFTFSVAHQEVEYQEQEFLISLSNITLTGAVVEKVTVAIVPCMDIGLIRQRSYYFILSRRIYAKCRFLFVFPCRVVLSK